MPRPKKIAPTVFYIQSIGSDGKTKYIRLIDTKGDTDFTPFKTRATRFYSKSLTSGYLLTVKKNHPELKLSIVSE